MPKIDFRSLKNRSEKEIKEAKDLRELNEVFRKYLGKKGEITQILGSLKELPKSKKAQVGKKANLIKKELKTKIEEKNKELKEKARREMEKRELIDVTVPAEKIELGHLHPLTSVRRKVEEIFESMGFSVIEGPEIESEWYNFDALNIPKDHPARDAWDTFWLKDELNAKKLLLRTHTSPVQIRYMEENNPPLRIIVPGRVFRHEASDASHDVQFYQIEGLMIDRDITLANLKGILKTFVKLFFGEDIEFRWRPGYFPFVEPGLEVDIKCLICGGKGCPACKRSGWVETVGAGMVHPNVLKAVGLNPKNWQGFAFGMGFDRLVMTKYKINDIRLFYSGDLRFLKQF